MKKTWENLIDPEFLESLLEFLKLTGAYDMIRHDFSFVFGTNFADEESYDKELRKCFNEKPGPYGGIIIIIAELRLNSNKQHRGANLSDNLIDRVERALFQYWYRSAAKLLFSDAEICDQAGIESLERAVAIYETSLLPASKANRFNKLNTVFRHDVYGKRTLDAILEKWEKSI